MTTIIVLVVLGLGFLIYLYGIFPFTNIAEGMVGLTPYKVYMPGRHYIANKPFWRKDKNLFQIVENEFICQINCTDGFFRISYSYWEDMSWYGGTKLGKTILETRFMNEYYFKKDGEIDITHTANFKKHDACFTYISESEHQYVLTLQEELKDDTDLFESVSWSIWYTKINQKKQ